MVVSGPSWNTDQGVDQLCECLGVKPTRAMKVNGGGNPFAGAHHRPIQMSSDGFEYEHSWSDPKDDELCLNRVKPEETLVEARSGSDVQIDRQIWA